MAKSKPEKSFQEKLKSFFKYGVAKSGNLPTAKDVEFVLGPEVVSDLGPDTALSQRLKTMKDLTDSVRHKRLQEHGVELIWVKLMDLSDTDDDATRHEVLTFFEALVRGQFTHLDMMRAQIFRLLKQTKFIQVDLVYRVKLLAALTDGGRDVLHFEEEIGVYMHELFLVILGQDSTEDNTLLQPYLTVLLNVIKFNSAYLDPEIVCVLIGYMSTVCASSNGSSDIRLCLQCLDAIICYNYIPKEALVRFICTLCRVVNMEAHCTEAWRITRNLMGTHLGHSALYSLCQILQTAEHHPDVALIRGAVFYVGMSLWGGQRVKTLDNYSPMTIVPTFIYALECKHHLVVYEVALQTEKLVAKMGPRLRAPGCDAVLCLVEKLLKLIPERVELSLQQEMLSHVHNIITSLEVLAAEKKYLGSKHRLYDVIDQCACQRPDQSVLRLIDYRANAIYPTKPGWIVSLSELVEKYYKLETRPTIRIKALQVLLQIFRSNRQIYEEDLLERIVVPFLSHADHEATYIVRLEAIKVLTAVTTESNSKKCIDLLQVLERITVRPLELKDANRSQQDQSHEDIKAVIDGLINIFCTKLCQQPASITVKVYNIIARHLEVNYENPDIFGHTGAIRAQIFRLFMRLRANETLHLGVENEQDSQSPVHFSPFVVCRQQQMYGIRTDHIVAATAGNNKNVTYISLTKACMMVIKSLSQERDWQVLKLVLAKVPSVLQNKAIFSLYGSDIKAFVIPLIELTSNSSRYPEILNNIGNTGGSKFTRSDFQNHVFPVLAAMAPYNEYLESTTTKTLIKALQNGLLSKECNRICIVALTACALEMKKSMYTLIPTVLLNFSKMSATKLIATPMLEFLSTLIRLPDIFSSFIETHYMSVFAIALPFTNPFKFDAYTVSLAHHVIIMWFLKCRLSYRQNFVQFIVTGLNSNVVRSFEEGDFRKMAATMNNSASSSSVAAAAAAKMRAKSGGAVDFATRLRSNSFTEDIAIKSLKERHPTAGHNKLQGSSDEEQKYNKMMLFHQELSDTCIDLLATYMFANVSVKPKRLPTAEFLLKGGQAASWVIGTMIITITTSICDQTSNRGGLCDRCYLICAKTNSNGNKDEGNEEDSARGRHMSDVPVGSPNKYPPLLLNRQLSSSDKTEEQSEGNKSDMGQMTRLEELMKKQKEEEKRKPEMCSCWCTGWAEIHVRRPGGDVSWMCRIQNASLTSESHADFPLTDLTALFHPAKEPFDEPSHEPLESLSDNKQGGGTYSVFSRNRSDDSLSEPGSPTKMYPSEPSFKPAENTEKAKVPVSKTVSSPEVGSGPADTEHLELPAADSSGGNKSNRQSCDPIPEVDEEERYDLLKRRTSLQPSMIDNQHRLAGPVHQQQQQITPPTTPQYTRAVLATPPRTPQAKDSPTHNPLFGHHNRQEAKQDNNSNNNSGGGGIRDRAHTISGPSPRRGSLLMSRGADFMGMPHSAMTKEHKTERVTGISPQFVFLALYHSQCFGNVEHKEKPLLMPATSTMQTSLRNLDRIYAHETHKIGVLYVGPCQAADEAAILGNPFGSLRYTDFLHGLGTLIALRDIDKTVTFLGGLDVEDGDGDYAYMWEDDVMQVIFHVATLMPNSERDPQCNKKKRHIGNDFVAIVYNNSGQEYKFGTVKGHFIYACVVITPLEQGSNRVQIQCKPELDEPLGHVKEPKIVSDRNLAILVRQMALHCNLAAQIQRSLSTGREPYASNWLERLRAIKRIRDKVTREQEANSKERERNSKGKPAPNDFTVAVLRKKDAKEDDRQ